MPVADPLPDSRCEQGDVFAGLLDSLQVPKGNQTPVFVEYVQAAQNFQTLSNNLDTTSLRLTMTKTAIPLDANWYNWICHTNMHGTCWTSFWKEL